MRFEVNVEKKYFFGILLIGLVLIGVVGVIAFGTSDPAFFGHSPGEIDWNQVIRGNVSAQGFCLGGVCLTNWSGVNVSGAVTTTTIATGGGESIWNRTGNNIYYTQGKVGIGVSNPQAALDVLGAVTIGNYANLGEDTLPTTWAGLNTEDNADTCPGGDKNGAYTCTPSEALTCKDIRNNIEKRTVICVVAKSGVIMNSTDVVFNNVTVRAAGNPANSPCKSGKWVVAGQGPDYYGPRITAAGESETCSTYPSVSGDWHHYRDAFACSTVAGANVNQSCIDVLDWNYATNGPGLNYRKVYCKPYIYGFQCDP